MAGRRRRDQGNSGVHAFLYVLVVLVLLGGMGYLFYYSRSQASERQEYMRELESKEAATKGWVRVTQPEEPSEASESEVETEDQAESESESKTEGQSESSSEVEVSSGMQTEGQSETDTEANAEAQGLNMESQFGNESESESTAEARSVMGEAVEDTDNASEEQTFSAENPRIMILNGTGKSGVASYWKRFLNGKGLTNVIMADYKGNVEERTVIYVTDGGDGTDVPQGVYDLFPEAEYRSGSLEDADAEADANIKVAAGQTEYDAYDVWIVVGKDDALHD